MTQRERGIARINLGLALLLALAAATAQAQTLVTMATPPGDGSVSVDVDGFGSFGYENFEIGAIGDALYDPVGAVGLSSTTWESALYYRRSGASTFLATGIVGEGTPSGSLPDPGFMAFDPTSATSAFSYDGLDFELAQRVEDVIVGPDRVGSVLIQEYRITNPGAATVDFDILRYYEGDLFLGFGAGVPDGGGRLVIGDEEFLFETDAAGEPSDTTNLVGITACGGTAPDVGRYEVNEWPDFPERITSDLPLADVVFGDGPDLDEFVDAGNDYDVGLALANEFSLGPGESATYVTTTVFGTAPPEEFTQGCAALSCCTDECNLLRLLDPLLPRSARLPSTDPCLAAPPPTPADDCCGVLELLLPLLPGSPSLSTTHPCFETPASDPPDACCDSFDELQPAVPTAGAPSTTHPCFVAP